MNVFIVRNAQVLSASWYVIVASGGGRRANMFSKFPGSVGGNCTQRSFENGLQRELERTADRRDSEE